MFEFRKDKRICRSYRSICSGDMQPGIVGDVVICSPVSSLVVLGQSLALAGEPSASIHAHPSDTSGWLEHLQLQTVTVGAEAPSICGSTDQKVAENRSGGSKNFCFSENETLAKGFVQMLVKFTVLLT